MDQSKGSTGTMTDWTAEDDYWRTNYENRPYVGSNRQYDAWQPAYRYGFESSQRHRGKRWEDVEANLRSGWDTYEHRRDNRTTWEQVKGAVRDAWDRVTGNR
jgi:hypothetical protein